MVFAQVGVAVENLCHRGWLSYRGAAQLGNRHWYWRLGYALWLESLRGPAHRAARGFLSPKNLAQDDVVYGETPLWTAFRLLEWGQLKPGQSFCEIGCGRAVVSLVADLVFSAKVWGFEIVPGLREKADWLSRALGAGVQLCDRSGGPYPQADLYYLTPTTWTDSNWEQVLRGLESAPTSARAVVLTQPIPGWKIVETQNLPYGWGWSRTYLMRKP